MDPPHLLGWLGGVADASYADESDNDSTYTPVRVVDNVGATYGVDPTLDVGQCAQTFTLFDSGNDACL